MFYEEFLTKFLKMRWFGTTELAKMKKRKKVKKRIEEAGLHKK